MDLVVIGGPFSVRRVLALEPAKPPIRLLKQTAIVLQCTSLATHEAVP